MTLRQIAGDLYRALAAPFGARSLDRMLRDGLPPRLEAPLRFLFTGEAAPDVLALAAKIETRRAEIAGSDRTYQFTYARSAHGMARWPEPSRMESEEPALSSRWLAAASVPRRWGVFLHLCAMEARAIVEMGTCVGISGAYLASAPSRPRLVTLEGSAALAAIAEETLARFSDRTTIVRGPFESGIHRALALLAAEQLKVDLAWIDGHHDEAPTLHYVRTLLPHLSHGALVVLDDILLYAGMRRAWQQVSAMRGVAAAVNTGRFGLLLWHGGDAAPRHYDLARHTGIWPSRKRDMPDPHAVAR